MASEASAPTIDRSRRLLLLARVLAGITLVSFAIAVVVTIADAMLPAGEGNPFEDITFVLIFGMFPVIGYVLAARRPENSIGWLMLGLGVFFALGSIVSSLGLYLLHSDRRDAALPFLAFDSPSWVPIVVLPVTFLLLLFPDGHLPSRRWRWFAWALGIGLTIVYLAILLDPAEMSESPVPNAPNPFGIEALAPFLGATQALILLILIGVIGSLTSLVLRFRRSSGIERLQLRWLLTAAVFVALLYAGVMIASIPFSWGGEDQPGWITVLQNIVIPSFTLIPIAIGVSILRYRLFDIDVVINKAVLFGALAVFITAVYVAIVVGVGALVGSQASPVLSAVAAAVVALAFQPARRRAQRFADRLVYGKRATPVRGPVGVLGAGRADLRERGPAAEDGPRARGGDRRGARRRVGAGRRGAPVGGAVAGGCAAGNGSLGRVRRAGGVAFIRLRAGSPPGRAPRRPLDREEAG